jgi:uracil-DNA glycosylase
VSGRTDAAPNPPPDCPICPRLTAYRDANRSAHPDWFNGAVPGFGPMDARLLVVGLAPGVRGANRSGRPFTGDFAGVLLYETLITFGFAEGHYGASPDDGLTLKDCRVTNAVRCVPPANLPKPAEISACNQFLCNEIAALPNLQVVLALGGIAHRAVLRACGFRASHVPFGHGIHHTLPSGLRLVDSYHVSRLNTNTKRLTSVMFQAVIADILNRLT